MRTQHRAGRIRLLFYVGRTSRNWQHAAEQGGRTKQRGRDPAPVPAVALAEFQRDLPRMASPQTTARVHA